MIILYCSLVLSCVWLGVTFSKKLNDRVLFYESFIKFLSDFESNLHFKQDNILNVINNADDFGKFLTEYISNNGDYYIEYLSKKELCQVKDIVNSLSSAGLDSAIGALKYSKMVVENKLKDYKNARQMYSGLSIKISLLIGLLLVVLLM